MKHTKWKRILAALFSIIFIVSLSAPAYAESDDTITVQAAKYYLYPYDDAVSALDTITQDRKIDALIYLCEAYGIKKEADPNSETVATIASGQSVKITGVSQDSGKNIWYLIEYTYQEEIISGYVEREYLASADERLLDFENTYVRSKMRSLLKSTVSTADVEQFPDSYQDALYALKTKHPNWIFVKMNTGFDWNKVVSEECYRDRNLIYAKSALSSWMNGMYDSTWAYCSQDIVKYYLDPRNFMSETSVFQFEQLVYNASVHSENTTQLVLNGSFMSGAVPGTSKTYANVFMEAGKTNKVSPILLASRVKQEQGTAGTSPLISGTYSGFEGLYNYYNIGASGQNTQAIATSGLTKARAMGWTTREASLIGGASFLSKNYINRGQDTLYLQKFDVDSSDGVTFTHQYMQNIQAPTSEAKSTFNAYNQTGLLTSAPFVFRIPVYYNMPSYAVTKPGSKEVLTLSTASITNLPVDQTAVINTYLNGSINTAIPMDFTSSDTSVASVDSNGVVTGIAPGTATITCKRLENSDAANTATCTVSVMKADILLSDITQPGLGELTYNPKTTLADIALPKGYAWVDSSLVPLVENQGYSVIYNPDNSKYNSLTFTLQVKVNKAQIPLESITLPTDLETAPGQELNTVALPQGFTWEEPNQILPKKTGTYTYKASYCNDIANYEQTTGISINVTVICTAHEFGDWTGTKADCTHDGTLTRSCSICGDKETLQETALGHKYVSEVTKEPTAAKPGIRTFTCERCQDTYTEEIPATGSSHEHSFTAKETKKAACTETGVMTYTCSCGYSYEETIEALGHNIVNGACTRCEYKEPSLPVHSHSYTVSGTTATCTEAGVTTYTCSCGAFYTEDAPALGHNMVDGTCTRCGYTAPTATPTSKPTATPTSKPTATPTVTPTAKPTATPTSKPTAVPTNKPTATPTAKPTATPTSAPTAAPTSKPTATPTSKPTSVPTSAPTAVPTSAPTAVPTSKPTAVPTSKPTATPTSKPIVTPDTKPIATPTATPTTKPTAAPTAVPTSAPASDTAAAPTAKPTTQASANTQTGVTPAATAAPQPTSVPATQPTDTQPDKVTPAPEKAEVTSVAKPDSLNVVRINMQDSSVLTASKIGKLSEQDEALELVMADQVIWYINTSSIGNTDELNIDMGVSLGKADIPDKVLAAAAEDKPYEVLSLSYDGPFTFDATLAIPVKAEYQGMVANLLYYNPDTRELEFVGAATVSEEGYAEFDMQHASDYMIVFAEASMETQLTQKTESESGEDAVTASASQLLLGKQPILSIILMVIIAVLIIAVIVICVVMIQIHGRQQNIREAEEEERLEEEREMAREAAREAAIQKKKMAMKKKKQKEDAYYLDEEDE